jgi:hypothetical protein
VFEWQGEFFLLLAGHVLLLQDGGLKGGEEIAGDDHAANAGDQLGREEERRKGGREGGEGK